MSVILFVWTAVASFGIGGSTYRDYDWRPFGEFKDATHCAAAAQQLRIDPKRFRCIPTGK